MTGLAIFGWLMLCGGAALATLTAVQLFFFCMGFAGRLPWQWWFYVAAALGLTALSIYTFPFRVEVKVESADGR